MSMFMDFESVIKNMGELPASPVVATKLLELLRKPDLKIKELANAVSLDPVISARLLRMANSVFYQLVKQVNTVDRAIIIVGEDVLKNLALEYSLRSTSRTFGVMERKMWEHSIGCAVASRMLADRLTDIDKDVAYLTGLQHHIGKVVMVNRDKELYRQVRQAVESGQGQLRDVERALFAYSHEVVGAALLDYWNYPKMIVEATLFHYEFEKIRVEKPEIFKLCAVINLASDFCHHFGVGFSEEMDIDLSLSRGALALEANPMIVEDLAEKFYPTFIKERNLFLS
ncbi:HD-like signal output (HDOD) domain, no enzymatic activity [Desulfuromusa kysingii]|uniref:HD-like signal output (HDOD) domain, no enzymatic activity n=1 Tax=Desulfuromusa kysingii TaxID=37625 RepID=A0A1H3XMN2_9BACT|nr:HDOD domain-containing protein [Desulfuromusa kysingii]SEA00500.1 HD-like signal output (HDOD) domain, no enzymatic activity [Desulfuromusa kysingii]